ncbi:hypothetical protein CsSME_00035737 [Camellia sinensis var. sinensis]
MDGWTGQRWKRNCFKNLLWKWIGCSISRENTKGNWFPPHFLFLFHFHYNFPTPISALQRVSFIGSGV